MESSLMARPLAAQAQVGFLHCSRVSLVTDESPPHPVVALTLRELLDLWECSDTQQLSLRTQRRMGSALVGSEVPGSQKAPQAHSALARTCFQISEGQGPWGGLGDSLKEVEGAGSLPGAPIFPALGLSFRTQVLGVIALRSLSSCFWDGHCNVTGMQMRCGGAGPSAGTSRFPTALRAMGRCSSRASGPDFNTKSPWSCCQEAPPDIKMLEHGRKEGPRKTGEDGITWLGMSSQQPRDGAPRHIHQRAKFKATVTIPSTLPPFTHLLLCGGAGCGSWFAASEW